MKLLILGAIIIPLLFPNVGFGRSVDQNSTVCRVVNQVDVSVQSIVSSANLVLAARGARSCLECQNKDASNPVYVGFDAQGASQQGFQIIHGAIWLPPLTPTNAIWMSSTGASVTVTCYEGIVP